MAATIGGGILAHADSKKQDGVKILKHNWNCETKCSKNLTADSTLYKVVVDYLLADEFN